MRVIHKYVLNDKEDRLPLPRGSVFLTVQIQKDQACIWVEQPTDPDIETINRGVKIVATGQEFNDPYYAYLSTFQVGEGMLVWHVYVEQEEEL